jgi:diguanylate cyclase (GGDEF)-like protein
MNVELFVGAVVMLMLLFLLRQNRILSRSNRNLLQRGVELEENMQTDPLTGLHNRFTMLRLKESQAPFEGVVAVLDLDHMKRVNDELGHLAGDEVLAEVGSLIRASIRREDVGCRWGGDEFIIIFYDQHLRMVERRMRHIQTKLKKFRLRSQGVLPLGISWGLAQSAGKPLAEALAVADEAMYQMKRLRKGKPDPQPAEDLAEDPLHTTLGQ